MIGTYFATGLLHSSSQRSIDVWEYVRILIIPNNFTTPLPELCCLKYLSPDEKNVHGLLGSRSEWRMWAQSVIDEESGYVGRRSNIPSEKPTQKLKG